MSKDVKENPETMYLHRHGFQIFLLIDVVGIPIYVWAALQYSALGDEASPKITFRNPHFPLTEADSCAIIHEYAAQ